MGISLTNIEHEKGSLYLADYENQRTNLYKLTSETAFWRSVDALSDLGDIIDVSREADGTIVCLFKGQQALGSRKTQDGTKPVYFTALEITNLEDTDAAIQQLQPAAAPDWSAKGNADTGNHQVAIQSTTPQLDKKTAVELAEQVAPPIETLDIYNEAIASANVPLPSTTWTPFLDKSGVVASSAQKDQAPKADLGQLDSAANNTGDTPNTTDNAPADIKPVAHRTAQAVVSEDALPGVVLKHKTVVGADYRNVEATPEHPDKGNQQYGLSVRDNSKLTYKNLTVTESVNARAAYRTWDDGTTKIVKPLPERSGSPQHLQLDAQLAYTSNTNLEARADILSAPAGRSQAYSFGHNWLSEKDQTFGAGVQLPSLFETRAGDLRTQTGGYVRASGPVLQSDNLSYDARISASKASWSRDEAPTITAPLVDVDLGLKYTAGANTFSANIGLMSHDTFADHDFNFFTTNVHWRYRADGKPRIQFGVEYVKAPGLDMVRFDGRVENEIHTLRGRLTHFDTDTKAFWQPRVTYGFMIKPGTEIGLDWQYVPQTYGQGQVFVRKTF